MKNTKTNQITLYIFARLTAKTMPTRSETVNMIKAKVGAKINTGVYKLRVNDNDLKGNVWKIFTLIARASDDVIVDGCFYCTKCNIVQVSRLHSRALSSHKCMHGLHQSKISIKYVQRQIDTGIYKVIHNDELINPLWKVFSFIAKRNGSSIVTGVVFCRYCEIVLEFNDGNEEQLKQHKCYKDYGAQQKR